MKLFFAKGKPSRRTYYLHIAKQKTEAAIDPLKFRNRLRENEVLRMRYRTFKLDLADQFTTDRKKYTEGKTDFIQSVLRRG